MDFRLSFCRLLAALRIWPGGSIKDVGRMSVLSTEELAQILKVTLLEEAGCYRAAFDLVVNAKCAPDYVLGFATNCRDRVRAPHAWVRLADGRFADPLLQHLGLLSTTTYVMGRVLSRDEVVNIVTENNTPEDIRNRQFYPPRLRLDGTLACGPG